MQRCLSGLREKLGGGQPAREELGVFAVAIAPIVHEVPERTPPAAVAVRAYFPDRGIRVLVLVVEMEELVGQLRHRAGPHLAGDAQMRVEEDVGVLALQADVALLLTAAEGKKRRRQ